MTTLMEGKVVVVTGAGGGIGRDIALAMARDGASVVVNDLGASLSGEGTDQAPANKVAAEIVAPAAARSPAPRASRPGSRRAASSPPRWTRSAASRCW